MFPVKLRIYDLSNGMAASMSMPFLGFKVNAIYHTSVEVFGKEYLYGGGILSAQPGTVQSGQLMEVKAMGNTEVTKELFDEFLDSIRGDYAAQKYNLLSHNCNNFTDECTQFLVSQNIPQEILDLPKLVLNSKFGPLIQGFMQPRQL